MRKALIRQELAIIATEINQRNTCLHQACRPVAFIRPTPFLDVYQQLRFDVIL